MTSLFEPFIRDVAAPLTEAMLRPPHPRCRTMQFSRALSDTDYRTMADWLVDYPAVTLRATGPTTAASQIWTSCGSFRTFTRSRRTRSTTVWPASTA